MQVIRPFLAGAVVAAALAASAGARAEGFGNFIDGNRLYQACAGGGGARASFCTGYIVGIVDALMMAGSARQGCIPKRGMVGQIVDAVKQSLTAHPELRDYSGAYLVAHALAESFPCK
jgi:hypothetical protein